ASSGAIGGDDDRFVSSPAIEKARELLIQLKTTKESMMMMTLKLDQTRIRRQEAKNQRVRVFKKPSTTKETSKDDAINTAGKDVVRDDDQPQVTSKPKTDKTPNPEWFKKPPRSPIPDLELNKRHVVLGQPEQLWFNQMVSATKDPLTFNDLMATPIDFSKYVLNRLKINNLTQDLLLGPAYNLLKGTCTRSIELEYNCQECFNALTDKLDWNNTEGYCYHFRIISE
nr:hypothetical protein [Tanacetum cinerariifolium]